MVPFAPARPAVKPSSVLFPLCCPTFLKREEGGESSEQRRELNEEDRRARGWSAVVVGRGGGGSSMGLGVVARDRKERKGATERQERDTGG